MRNSEYSNVIIHFLERRTGVGCYPAGSFTHSAKFLLCPWGRDPWVTRCVVNSSYSFPQHFMPDGPPLEQVDPEAEAEAGKMAKLLLEEEEQVRRLFTLLSVGNMSIFFANHM
jgi:hypothetical protein